MTEIIESHPVYILHQRVHTGPPQPGAHDAYFYFLAERSDELEELVGLFRQGKQDGRIIEQVPAGDVYNGDFRVETVSFTDPNGQALDWSIAGAEAPAV
ncbi:MAG: hypothetical protein KA362_00280 [Chloroflexi bacterium]|nr:hypothetical protein [Chloroflexota bacterium]